MALSQIQSKYIVHRDIKMDNILIGNYDEENVELKIADFGIADILTPEKGTLY